MKIVLQILSWMIRMVLFIALVTVEYSLMATLEVLRILKSKVSPK